MRFTSLISLLLLVAVATSARADEQEEPDERGWAFRPVVRPAVPMPRQREWVRSPVDAFILQALEQNGLKPSPSPEGHTLVRRVFLDVVGLPPTPEQTDRFLSDRRPGAWSRLVERLLASPAYGHRWSQHWLDVVRYADSDGFEYDDPRPFAWRYRDWVIDALNSDKPFGRFVKEQIAADELFPGERDALAALGLHRMGPLRLNAGMQDEAQNRQERLTEIVDVVGSAFLGVTLACARCHDHKFDPFPQADYYRLQAFFAATEAFDIPIDPKVAPKARISGSAVEIEKKDSIMAVLDFRRDVPATFLLVRGESHDHGPEVFPSFPSVMVGRGQATRPEIKRRRTAIVGSVSDSTGRRASLAVWLTDRANPLTFRVVVNRLWQHHFGRGIVATPNDFGVMGAAATHPELLDWLAAELVDSGGSLKHVHRLMLCSATYRQSSTAANPMGESEDPGNQWLWRAHRRRLEAEALRDSLLSVSGRLNPHAGGPGVRLPLPPEVAALQYKGDWKADPDRFQHNRRTVFLFVKRNNRPPLLSNFDAPGTMTSCGRRSDSSHAGQALTLLNSPLLDAQSRAFAERLQAEAGQAPVAVVQRAYRLALGRPPAPEELSLGRAFLESGELSFAEVLADYCLVLFNLDEFLYVE